MAPPLALPWWALRGGSAPRAPRRGRSAPPNPLQRMLAHSECPLSCLLAKRKKQAWQRELNIFRNQVPEGDRGNRRGFPGRGRGGEAPRENS